MPERADSQGAPGLPDLPGLRGSRNSSEGLRLAGGPSLVGTLTALVTPFRDGAIDHEALEQLVAHQLAGNVDSLVVCGTTGETPTLTPAERADVMQRVVRAARGRIPVVGGVGSNNTAELVHDVRACRDFGLSALLIVTPYYNRPSQEGLFRHFSAAAEATDLPIVLYNIPGRCGVELSVETMKRLRGAHANIVAVKHATGSVPGATEVLAETDLAVLSGDDPLTLPLMSIGAVGVVSVLSNLLPAAVKALTRAALGGDWAAARAAHEKTYALARGLLTLDTNPVPIKTALAICGLCREEFRLPLCPMSPGPRAALAALLAQHGPH